MTVTLAFAQDVDATLHNKISKLEKEIDDLKKQAASESSTPSSLDSGTEGETLKRVKNKVAAKSKVKQEKVNHIDDSVRPLGSTKASADVDVDDTQDQEVEKPKINMREEGEGGTEEHLKKDFSNAEELYSQGQLYMRQRQITKALDVLTQFTEKYSDSPQFMLASYWLGEVHLEKKDFTNASIAYGTAYSAYKKLGETGVTATSAQRNKAAESLAKLAYCLKMMKKGSDGCTTLGQIDKEFKTIPKNLQVYIVGLKTELKCKK